MATPGHTHGSLSFLESASGGLFCGDLRYTGNLYAHFSESDLHAYRATLHRLQHRRPPIRVFFPGHAHSPLAFGFVATVVDALEAVAAARAPNACSSVWGFPVRRHQWRRLEVLTPVPGQDRIDLAALLARDQDRPANGAPGGRPDGIPRGD